MDQGVQGIARQVIFWVGVLLSGAIFALVLPWTRDASGGAAAAMLLAERPAAAIGAVLGALVAATILASVVGRLTNGAVGLFVLGCGLAVLALRGGSIESLALQGQGSLGVLGTETALWCVALLLASVVVFGVSGPLPDIDPTDDDGRPVRLWSSGGMGGALAGLCVIPAVWLIAQSPMKGQTIMAATIGGMAAGTIARLVRAHPKPVLLFAAPCAFGAVAHFIAASMLDKGVALDAAYVKGILSNLNFVMPADYAAGSLLGVSIGLGMGKSMVHQTEGEPGVASA